MVTQKRKYPLRDVKLLWALSAARCAFPGCREPCVVAPESEVDKHAIIGDIAHIYPHSKEGPRGIDILDISLDRDSYFNWVLLCTKHHRIVDQQPSTYRAEWLFRAKIDLEQWVESKLVDTKQAMAKPNLPSATVEFVYRVFRPEYGPMQARLPLLPTGSFDDPFGEFAVLYTAPSLKEALLEMLAFAQSFRMFSQQLHDYKIAKIDSMGLNLYRLDTLGILQAEKAIRQSLGSHLSSVNMGTSVDRRATQAVTRWVEGLTFNDGSPRYDGIIANSRAAADVKLVIIFPRGQKKLKVLQTSQLSADDLKIFDDFIAPK